MRQRKQKQCRTHTRWSQREVGRPGHTVTARGWAGGELPQRNMSNAANAYKNEKIRSEFQGLRENKTRRSENENACLKPTASLAGDQKRANIGPP